MLFYHLKFIFGFLPVMLLLYYGARLIGSKWKKGCLAGNLVLLISSVCFLWMSGKDFLPVFLLMFVFDYGAGWLVTNRSAETGKTKRRVRLPGVCLFVCIVFHVALLIACFRYAPLGLPVCTLHAVSYLTDVYRGKAEVQKNPLLLAIYMFMFPLMIVGPVLKYHETVTELSERKIEKGELLEGTCRLAVGWLKIILLGLTFQEAWGTILEIGISNLPVITALFGVFLVFLEAYFILSGLSDMAVGMGKLLGFHYPENFRTPYTALSLTDFWQRWFMSLASWFYEYVFSSIGGKTKEGWQRGLCALAAWICFGLLCRLSVNGAFFGLFFGALLIMEVYVQREEQRLPKTLKRAYTLLAVAGGWMLLAFDTPYELFSYIKAVLGFNHAGIGDQTSIYLIYSNLLFIFAALAGLTSVPGKLLNLALKKRRKQIAVLGYWCVSLIICAAGLLFSGTVFQEKEEENKYFCKISTWWDYLSNRQETQEIYFGEDGHLFSSHKAYRVNQKTVSLNLNRIETWMDYFEEHKTQTSLCILLPDAACVLEDDLPAFAPEYDESAVEAMANEILGDHYISAMQTLKEKENEEIYYRTETGLTTLGAFYAYEQWVALTDFPALKYRPLTARTVSEKFYGSLSRTIRFYPKADTLIRFQMPISYDITVRYSDGTVTDTIFEDRYLSTKEQMNYYLNGEQDAVDISVGNSSQRSLLLLTDDNGRRFAQFFVTHFNHILIINTNMYEGDIQDLQEEYAFTDVLALFEMSSLYQ